MKNMRQSVKLDHNFPGDRLSNPLNLVISLAVQHPFFGPMVFFERPGPFRNLQTEKKKKKRCGGPQVEIKGLFGCFVWFFFGETTLVSGRCPGIRAPHTLRFKHPRLRCSKRTNHRVFWGMRFTPFPIENQGLCGCFQK